MSRPWMPLYVADYLADTRRLSLAEHGAYMLLIMDYWRNGGLPDDDRKLARIVGASLEEWSEIRVNIADLFQPGWRHKRIDEELQKSETISERRSANARRRWSKRDANALQVDANADANAMQTACTRAGVTTTTTITSPVTTGEEAPAPRKASRAKPRSSIAEDQRPTPADAKVAVAAGLSSEAFLAEWRKFRDYHRSRGSLMADWSAAWRTWLAKAAEFKSRSRAGPSGERRDPILQAGLELMEEYANGYDRQEFANDYSECGQLERLDWRTAG